MAKGAPQPVNGQIQYSQCQKESGNVQQYRPTAGGRANIPSDQKLKILTDALTAAPKKIISMIWSALVVQAQTAGGGLAFRYYPCRPYCRENQQNRITRIRTRVV